MIFGELYEKLGMRSVNKRGRHVSDGAVASLEEFQEVLEMMTGHRGMEESACREV